MKKIIFAMMGLMLVALPVWGATFPVADDHTLVSSDTNGLVTVKVTGETDGWYMVLYCQDDLAATCGNKFPIQPSSVTGTSMTFQLDMAAVKDGQVAFNFRRNCDKKWLAIPDCRVKTGSNIGMGMSYFSSEREESGGAHFVYTGSGIKPYTKDSPIDASKWCDEGMPKITQQSVTKVVEASGPNSITKGTGTVAIASGPSSMAVAAKDSAVSQQKAGVVEVHAKNVKGSVITTTRIKQQVNNTSQRGSTMKAKKVVVKGNNNEVNCTRNINITIQNMGNTTVSSNDCASCHDNRVWSAFTSYTGSKKGQKSNIAPPNNIKSPVTIPKGKTFLDGTPRGTGK